MTPADLTLPPPTASPADPLAAETLRLLNRALDALHAHTAETLAHDARVLAGREGAWS